MRTCLIGLLAAGCSGSVEPTDVSSGLCGAVTTHTVSLEISVVDADSQPVADASVALEEREWEPATLGTGTTGANGAVSLSNLSITGVEDCWGVVLDYVVVVEKGERRSETRFNAPLFNAVTEGEPTVSRSITLD